MFRLLALFAMVATAHAACDASTLTTCSTAALGKIAADGCSAYQAYAKCYTGDCCTDAAKTAFAAYADAIKTLGGCTVSFCGSGGSTAAASSVSGSQKITFTALTVAEANTNSNKAALRCGAANAYAAKSCTAIAGVGCTVSSVFDATTNVTQNVTSCTGAVTPTFSTGTTMDASVAASRRAGSAITFAAKFLTSTISQAAFTTASTPATFQAALQTAMASLPSGWASAVTAADIAGATVAAATGIKISGASSVAPAMATLAVVGVAALFH